MNAFLVISALYLPFVFVVTAMTGHLYYLGDESLFFSSSDSGDYKLVADYYTSFGSSEKPSDYLLRLRTFMFPLYLSLYRVIGIAGVQILQIIMNGASLSLVFVSIKSLGNRSWIAGIGTILLGITPSFNFLAFHALTESLCIFLIGVFIALIADYFTNHAPHRLFQAGLIVSLLLCIRPIILPFWVMFIGYCSLIWIRNRDRRAWQPIVCITPVLCQLMLSFAMTGSPTLSSSGGINIAAWYFPIVYGEKEYGQRIHRKSKEAEEGMRRFPEMEDKVAYLIRNYRESVKVYVHILIGDNLMAGSNFVRTHTQTDERNERVLIFLQRWSVYLNRFFAGIHTTMLALMASLVFFGLRVYEHKTMLACYIFAALLVLPTGIVYYQGDRYVLLAEPLWLVAHSALIGLLFDRLKHHSKAHSPDKELIHT